LVVHGEPGLDELSPLGPTRIIEVKEGALRSFTFDPAAQLGWRNFDPAEMAGGGPQENATIIAEVLRGERAGAARAAVALNTAAALFVAGHVADLATGVQLAEQGLDSGAGWDQLQRIREASTDNQIVITA